MYSYFEHLLARFTKVKKRHRIGNYLCPYKLNTESEQN